MGVLLGGFGKLQQGSYYREIQRKLMNVSSRLKKATRQVSRVEQQISRLEKSGNNSLRIQQQALLMSGMAAIKADTIAKYEGKDAASFSDTDKQAFATAQQQYSSMMAELQAKVQMQVSMAQEQLDQQIQMMRDIQLEAAKDEEDSLQQEKDSLESQKQLAYDDYKACKEMEKADAEMFKPSYAAGGQA